MMQKLDKAIDKHIEARMMDLYQELDDLASIDYTNLSEDEMEALFDFGKIGDLLDKVKNGAHKVLGTVAKITHNKDIANADKMVVSAGNAAEGLLGRHEMEVLNANLDKKEVEALWNLGNIGGMLSKIKNGAHSVLGTVAKLTHNKDIANADKMVV